MRNAERILRNTGITSSENDFRILRKFSTIYSEIYIIEMRGDKAHLGRMVLKLCRTKTPKEVVTEFESLSRFNAKFDDGRIGVPKALAVDPSSRAIVMEYVDGISLKKLLLRPGSARRGAVLKTIDLAAVGLARFHKASKDVVNEEYSIDSPFLTKNLELIPIRHLLDSCSLDFTVKSFIDFSAWNIVVESDSAERITLIDFPDNDSVFTPHIDLARFKYSLDILSLHPQFRFLGLRWWNPDELQDKFLASYSSEMGTRTNDEDCILMRWFERQYFRKLQKVYYDGNSRIRYMLEGLYMRKFISDLLRNECEEVRTNESPTGN